MAEELLELSQQLVDCIATADWTTYKSWRSQRHLDAASMFDANRLAKLLSAFGDLRHRGHVRVAIQCQSYYLAQTMTYGFLPGPDQPGESK